MSPKPRSAQPVPFGRGHEPPVQWVRAWHRTEQLLRIGMLWLRQNVGAGAGFNDAAFVHHGYAVTDTLDDRNVV